VIVKNEGGLCRFRGEPLIKLNSIKESHVMSASTETLLRQALELPSNDRAVLVEELITSLDQPDPELDALWLKEAEHRIAAYRAGELGAVDADDVFAG
jgi:putative addiction module component (TIGR02574 family)